MSHNGLASVSNHQPHGCFLNILFRRRSKKTSKLRVAGLCEGNSPGTGEFPAQMASNAENVSIWWRHHDASMHVHIFVRADCRDQNKAIIVLDTFYLLINHILLKLKTMIVMTMIW